MEKHIKKLHLGLIALTCLLPLIAVFNSNLWFDEAYSVGLVNQNWGNLIVSGANDVHPILYYIMLKLFTMIFGNQLVVFRIFSLIPIVLLSIFSYTHIRKEFGEKVGMYFSFILLFLPTTLHYSTQIRMYSWIMFFIAVTAFYAYKVFQEIEKKQNWIIFAIFSVLSAYTHYFGLFTIGIINLILIYYIVKKKKEFWKKWFLYAAIQLIAYIPGLLIFLLQSLRVAGGFWISVNYPDIFMQIVEFLFQDTIESGIPSIFALFVFIYMILRVHSEYIKDKTKIRPVTIALTVCGLVIGVTLLISFVRPIFIPRYMLPMLSLGIFALSYILSKENKKWIKFVISLGLVILSIWNGYTLLNKAYSEENQKPFHLIREEIQEGDIFVYTTIGPSSLVALEFENNAQYFYNKDNWTVEKAYGAFAPQMKCINDLSEIENYHGRVWVIDSGYTNMYDYMKDIEGTKLLKDREKIYHPYSGDDFVISLFEKK